jgi:hypothetical protein
MTSWKEKATERLRHEGLLEPKTKSAKLRAILPVIEEALENGSSYKQCLAQLKLLGVEMSEDYFRNALYRVRKQGPLHAAGMTPAADEKRGALAKQEKQNEPKETRKLTASGATIVLKQQGGMFISSVEDKDQLTNAMPRMEDFI